jgi:carbon-monoxide dehydrogenase medium subunit
MRVSTAEKILAQNQISGETIEKAAEAAFEACNPIDDVRATGRYRREMVRVFTRRGLESVWARLQEEG